MEEKYNIAVSGTGYVGMSIATLLSQYHHVTAIDIVPGCHIRCRPITGRGCMLSECRSDLQVRARIYHVSLRELDSETDKGLNV